MNGLTRCIETDSPEATRALGRRLGEALRGGEVIALIGALGAGKTQLVKGIAAGNGGTDPSLVTSPTFTLVNEYTGRVYLYHLDAYRLSSGAELAALGLDEMMRDDAAVVIEWADRALGALPRDRLTIRLEATGAESRRLTFESATSVGHGLVTAATGT
ncbi:MAG: tRNA (adenosine(37)-N6)-threonylcarbamoyltransferase complex ATPase subunit type 1 TsaE [Planctomycetes bacterium]|nr:tRNA (adenosine(37)-N6)-threonylcarbamoyltransferase complex ATPase subunit type 1 TsaE [Planctomycetota bacterium]